MGKRIESVPELDPNEDLDEAWAKVVTFCEKKWQTPLEHTTSAGQIVDRIRPESKDPELRDKAKTVFFKALKCLDVVGQIVAQAASAVFAPSQQVMNGVSFVVEALQNYEKIFSEFTTMMERIAAFLERLQIFLQSRQETVLDPRLRPTVYAVLIDFMSILDKSHDLGLSWRAKAKVAAKIFFTGDDGGVKHSLTDLEEKIARVTDMSVIAILQDVGENAKYLRKLGDSADHIIHVTDSTQEIVERTDSRASRIEDATFSIQESLETQREQQTEKEQTEQAMARIQSALRPDIEAAWRDSYLTSRSKLLDGAGAWLLDESSVFRAWSDPSRSMASVLMLSGSEGYGKSCLCSAVVQRLLQMSSKGSTGLRTSIAYYFFQRDAKEKASIDRAVRNVLYQLTQADAQYGAAVADILEAKEDIDQSGTTALWQKLVGDLNKTFRGTFFIVLDGIDEPEADAERPLLSIVRNILSLRPLDDQSEDKLDVRMLISGRPDGIKRLQDACGSPIMEFKLGRPLDGSEPINQQDMVSLIAHRVGGMKAFQGEVSKEILELKERIPRDLATGVKGDFVSLDYKLDEIRNVRTTQQVRQILDRASETRENAVSRELASINASLRDDEISEVNEILAWIIGAMDIGAVGWVDVQCLEGVLLAKDGTATVGLTERIKDLYGPLFSINREGFVTLFSNEIRSALLSADRVARSVPAISMEVQEAEIAIVKRVVSTFCGEDLYNRFQFARFFDTFSDRQGIRIQVTLQSLHSRMVLLCLNVLCSEPNREGLKSVRGYARCWLAEHLQKVDMGFEDPVILKDIGSRLCRLLTEPVFINVWWERDALARLRKDWIELRYNDRMQIFRSWLGHPTVVEGLSDIPSLRDWAKRATTTNVPKDHVMFKVLRTLAHRWFREGSLPPMLKCVQGLYNRIFNKPLNIDGKLTLPATQALIKWARHELSELRNLAVWNWRIAATFYEYEHWQNAMTSCERVLRQNPDHFATQSIKAQCLRRLRKFDDAIEWYKKLAEREAQRPPSAASQQTRYQINAGFADCAFDMEHFEVAADLYHSNVHARFAELNAVRDRGGWNDSNRAWYASFTLGPSIAIERLLKIWHSSGKREKLLELLKWLDCNDFGYPQSRLAAVISQRIEVTGLLRRFAQTMDCYALVERAFSCAIETADGDDLVKVLALQRLKGWLLWTAGPTIDEQDQALQIWAGIVARDIRKVESSSKVQVEVSRARLSMFQALSARVISFDPQSDAGRYYWKQLRLHEPSLSTVNLYQCNPLWYLGRSYQRTKQRHQARNAIRGMVYTAFRDWERLSQANRDTFIILLFTVTDDDINFIAACHLRVVLRLPAAVRTGKGSHSNPLFEGMSLAHKPTGPAQLLKDMHLAHEEEDVDLSAISWGHICNACRKTCWCSEPLFYCRYCLDTTFHPSCLAELKDGQLDRATCSKDHDFLKVPILDMKRWLDLARDGKMLVGDTIMSQSGWLASVREAWDLQPERMERIVQSVKVLSRFWRRRAQRRRK